MTVVTNRNIALWLDSIGQHLPYHTSIANPDGSGADAPFTEDSWTAAKWNPPQGYIDRLTIHPAPGDDGVVPPPVVPDVPPDPTAPPKPTWASLTTNIPAVLRRRAAEDARFALDAECRRRITVAYEADDWQDEIQRRLGGRTTEAQDTERDRLRAAHATLVAWIDDADRTLAELEAFDATDEAHWTAADGD